MASLPLVVAHLTYSTQATPCLFRSSATQRQHLAQPTSSHCAAGVSPSLPPAGGAFPLPPPTVGAASPLRLLPPTGCACRSAPAPRLARHPLPAPHLTFLPSAVSLLSRSPLISSAVPLLFAAWQRRLTSSEIAAVRDSRPEPPPEQVAGMLTKTQLQAHVSRSAWCQPRHVQQPTQAACPLTARRACRACFRVID